MSGYNIDSIITIKDVEQNANILREQRALLKKAIDDELLLKIEQLQAELRKEKDATQQKILLNVIESLQSLKNEDDMQAQEMIIRVANAVRESKKARESADKILDILKDEKISKTGSLKVLQEATLTIKHQDEVVKSLESNIKKLKDNSNRQEKQARNYLIIALAIVVILGGILAIISLR